MARALDYFTGSGSAPTRPHGVAIHGVIGVVSGTESDYSFPFSSERSNVMAGGAAMKDLIAWARTTWRL